MRFAACATHDFALSEHLAEKICDAPLAGAFRRFGRRSRAALPDHTDNACRADDDGDESDDVNADFGPKRYVPKGGTDRKSGRQHGCRCNCCVGVFRGCGVFRFAAGSRAVRPLLKVRAILPHPTMSEVSDISEKKSRNQTAETGSEKMYVSAFVQRATWQRLPRTQPPELVPYRQSPNKAARVRRRPAS